MFRYIVLFFLCASFNFSFASPTDTSKFFTTSKIIKDIQNIDTYWKLMDSIAIDTSSKKFDCQDNGGTLYLWKYKGIVVKIEFDLSYEYFEKVTYRIYFKDDKAVCLFRAFVSSDPGCGDPERELEEDIVLDFQETPEEYYVEDFIFPYTRLTQSRIDANYGILTIKWCENWRDFGLTEKNYKDFFGSEICD